MSDNQASLSDAIKALASATADLTKAATVGLGRDVSRQVSEALQSAAVAVDDAAKKVAPPAAKQSTTREEILVAAAEVFSEKGFDAASLDEIAKRAGRTKGAIYAHFQSKDDLMVALAKGGHDSGELDEGTKEIVIAFKEGRLGEFIDDSVSGPEYRKTALLSLEILIYAFRHPEHRDAIIEAQFCGMEQLQQFLAQELPGVPGDSALALASIVNMGAIYAALSPEIVDGAAVERSLRRAIGATPTEADADTE